MAWTCSSVTNEGMIRLLQEAALVSTPSVIEALLRVDRRLFVPDGFKHAAYKDQPIPIGHGATISAPHMHVIMLEHLAPFLNPKSDGSPIRVLDVGSGSGYLTAVLAELCGEKSSVIGLEHVDELRQRAQQAVHKHFPTLEKEGRIRFITGDGRNLPEIFSAGTAFDVIHVGAAASSVPPGYFDALLPGGCLVIPVGEENHTQVLRVYTKSADGRVTARSEGKVIFVPLTSLAHQETRL